MKGNPTTGYAWYLSQNSISSYPGLRSINLNQYNSTDEYYSDVSNSNPPLMGVGGTYCFKFQYQNMNSSSLNFEYYQIWDKKVANSYNFTIVWNNSIFKDGYTLPNPQGNNNVSQTSYSSTLSYLTGNLLILIIIICLNFF